MKRDYKQVQELDFAQMLSDKYQYFQLLKV